MRKIYNYLKYIFNFIIRYDDEIIKAYKEIKADGKISLSDFLILFDLYKTSGFLIDEESENEVFNAGALDPMPANPYKKLFVNQQGARECVPNTVRRVTIYNTNIEISEANFFLFLKRLYDKKLLIKNKGMTFRACLDEWNSFILETKNRKLKYTRSRIWTNTFKNFDRLGYARLIGGHITSKYLADFRKDDVINDKYTWTEKKKYGHAFTELDTAGAKKHGGNIVDNYNKTLGAHNIYTNNRILDFVKNGYFFAYWYFIFLDENFTIKGENIKNKQDFKVKEEKFLDDARRDLDVILDEIDLEKAKKLVELGIWSGSNPKHPASKQESSNMDYNIIVYIFESLGRSDLIENLKNGNNTIK